MSYKVNYCHTRYCCHSCPERIAAEAHQNIAGKAVQRNCCRISPKIMLQELPRENCCRSSPKYCCQSRPEKLLPNLTKKLLRELPRENCCRISPKYCCQCRPEKLLPNLNNKLLRKLPREKTWDDSWQNQSSQGWNQRLLNHSYLVVKY